MSAAMLALIGIVLALGIGIGCRVLDIPLPAPPRLEGALLVLAMTAGYLAGDQLFGQATARCYKASAPARGVIAGTATCAASECP